MQTLTKTYSGAKILTETLKQLGTDTIFGYPGGIVLGLYDELALQNDIKHYLVRHEQAAIHAAEGYARVSGKCGVVVVTSGPGATNIVTGLANAYLDGYPIIAITGQVSSELLHTDAFQEVDIIDITKSCTKKNFQVKSAKDLQTTLKEAFKTAMTGKQGPVVVDITKNVFSEEAEFHNINISIENNRCDFSDLQRALDTILSAKSPVIIAGGGINQANASKEITKFAKCLNIPVVSTMMGLGTYPMSDENYIGMIGIFGHNSANKAIRESDLIFAVGTRFNDRINCCFANGELSKKLIHIDINPDEISKSIPAYIGLTGDAKSILAQMNSLLDSSTSCSKEWLEYTKNLKSKNNLPVKRSSRMHSFEAILEIQECIKNENFVVTTEVGQHQVWASKYLKFDEPRKFITSGGLGTMGFGFPAAIGACIAKNEPVICIAGDGSLQMNIQEIATCMDYNLPVKIFILNNGYLGMVRQFQEKMCGQRYFATKISNPDFVKLAESYGAKGIRVDKVKDIKSALKETLSYKGTVLVDLVIEPEEVL